MLSAKRTDITLSLKQQIKQDKYQTPGPGSYDISLPMIKPNYEAIRKNNDVIILKVNHHGDCCNFRSQQVRFPQQKQKSPGPAKYGQFSINIRDKKINSRKYSQRYTDLIQFMYRDRSKIQPIPSYKVEYDSQYESNLKKIKNSQRRYKQLYKYESQAKQVRKSINQSSLQNSVKSIVRIKSSQKLTMSIQSNMKTKINQNQSMNMSQKQKDVRKYELKTIDFPERSSQFKSTKRPLEKEENLLLHRKTLYNRSMLGMMIAKQPNKKSDKSPSIDLQADKKSSINSTIDYFS